MGAFKEDETKKILNVPEHIRVVAMTPLGYPNEPPSEKSRKRLNEIVCYEKYE
jgi:nitroreductase